MSPNRVSGSRAASARRAMLIGIDGGSLELVERFMAEGLMPNVARLAERGVRGTALPSIPVDTPTNWTTIATGAQPATHGIHSFTAHWAGEPLELGETDILRNKQATSSRAEFLWTAAQRQGLRTLVLNYPTGWPALDDGQLVVGGVAPGGHPDWRLAKPRVFSRDAPRVLPMDLAANQFAHTPVSFAPDGDDLVGAVDVLDGQPHRLTLRLIRGPAGFERMLVTDAAGAELARLAAGEWSPWIHLPHDGGPVAFRLKLAALSGDGRQVELYRTDVVRLTGWSHPPSLAAEISDRFGPYVEGLESPFVPVDDRRRPYGPLNVAMATVLEQARFQADWMARVAGHLRQDPGWELLVLHYHLIDSINHTLLGYLDPSYPYTTPERTAQAWDAYRAAYGLVDDLVGMLLEEAADPDTLVAIVSDHAALPCWRYVSIAQALHQAELLRYRWDAASSSFRVDLAASRAVPYLDPQYVWVNLVGRQPAGCVPPDAYDAVCDEIIRALLGLRDPRTGECPVELACRREALGLVGAADQRMGDVVYFLKPGYTTWDGLVDSLRFSSQDPERLAQGVFADAPLVGGHHTPYLPTARHGPFANAAMLFLAGPGVRPGHRLGHPIRLTDVTPTLAHLLGIAPPRHAEGAVRAELLADDPEVG